MAEVCSPLRVRVWGDWACFTRPELKAERVSYPIMTPAAARGVLEAIFWKPEFRWKIQQIHVLNSLPALFTLPLRRPAAPTSEPVRPPAGESPRGLYRPFSILRNEVDRRATSTPIDIGESRAQRHTLGLRDVAYVIVADVEVLPGTDAVPSKYRDQFRRRVERGQCFQRPYLGCREFAADFAPVDETDARRRFHHAEPIDLGLMFFDMAHSSADPAKRPHRCGPGCTPVFFPARLEDGILNVPPSLYGRL